MKFKEKQKVIELRKRGMTISEIEKLVPVSRGTISLWMQGIKLSLEEEKRISNKITLGQMRSREVLREKSLLKDKQIEISTDSFFKKINITKELQLLICACIYECEGGKVRNQSMAFTNSDPVMISIFMKTLRHTFEIDENKFRVHLHIHSYHDKDTQLKFWSEITKIPLSQFMKTYMKKHSGVNQKQGYPGCITIRYYDVSVKRKLMSIFKRLEKEIS